MVVLLSQMRRQLRRADTTAGRKVENAGAVPQAAAQRKSPRWLDGLTAKIETENDGKTAGKAFEINCDRVRTPAERTLAFEAARLQ
ncbi:hypothetical protein NW381_004545 [Salmonella enterica]|nr:hypothetical protein [Salmonella enterica]EJS3017613.1 hypothetical protein [Salmonella enterica]